MGGWGSAVVCHLLVFSKRPLVIGLGGCDSLECALMMTSRRAALPETWHASYVFAGRWRPCAVHVPLAGASLGSASPHTRRCSLLRDLQSLTVSSLLDLNQKCPLDWNEEISPSEDFQTGIRGFQAHFLPSVTHKHAEALDAETANNAFLNSVAAEASSSAWTQHFI